MIEILDVGAIKRSDERAAYGGQHCTGHLIGFRLPFENLLAIVRDLVASPQQVLERLGTGDNDGGMPHEEIEETLFLWHEHLKPAKHRCFIFSNRN